MKRLLPLAFALALLPGVAAAAPLAFTDPVGDFLPTFTGPQNPDLDVIGFDATFDGTTFTFTDQANGPIGTTPGAIFVWGVNRGSNTAGFGTFRPGVLFDTVVIANPTGASTAVVDGVRTTLPAAATVVSGNTISISVPASLLPSTGFAPGAYQVNLWPRSGQGGNPVIADFAPDNSDVTVRDVAEPGTIALLAAGLAAAGFRRRVASISPLSS